MNGDEIGELHEIAEILDRAVAPALVEIVDERRAVVGREHRRLAADLHAALGVAGVLGVDGGRGRAELLGQPLGKAHALALDVGARLP